MGMPAAKQGDKIVSPADIHLVEMPTPAGPVVVPLPFPFSGQLTDGLSNDVKIMGKPAATKDSSGKNQPKHVQIGTRFINQPTNVGTVFMGSMSVKINGKPAARMGDPVCTCNDPNAVPVGKIVASGSVRVGG
ncbi:hypothetical protein PRUB_a0087 [Pseudoalteromonas rubra]|uniref:PAAR motif protein n=1 Tax=Pseudoalteromonas rubra TaxID=43658 RepID=A0A8T0C6R1_9GAMM|nr:PAAR domain-containing protein [Pseudoalteromonas rubra]KAF7785721.1 hypothetical protein PRUB_a0087 [Pseudoalteromonas rubra]